MSAAVRYRLEFNSKKYGDTYRIDILQEGYTGSVMYKNVGAGHVKLIKKEGKLQYTSLIISIQANNNFEYIDFFQYNTQKFPVKLYKNDVQIGSYFIVSESYSEPYVNPPYDVEIVATDGLGMLENYTFDNDGMQSYLDAIIHCLDNLELNLGFSIALDLFESNQSSSEAMLAQTYFDGTIFNGTDCKTVIEQLLPFGTSITQHNNKWLIRRPFEDIEKTHLQYTSAGEYSATGAGENVLSLGHYGGADVWPRGSAPYLSLEHAWQSVDVTEDYGLKTSIIENSDFTSFSGDAPTGFYNNVTFDGWDNSYENTLLTYIDNVPSMVLVPIIGTDEGDLIEARSVFNLTEPTLEAVSGQILSVKFDYYTISHQLSLASLDIELYLIIKVGSDYLDSEGEWTVTPTMIHFTAKTDYYKSIQNKNTFDIKGVDVPAGDILIQFFRPLWNHYAFAGWAIQNLQVEILNSTQDKFDSTAVTTLGIREESTHSGDSWTVKPADLPNIYNDYVMYQNGRYRLSGSDYIPTLTWSNNSKTATAYTDVLQAQLINYYGDPKQTISGTYWRGSALHLNSVVKHALNYNRVFIADSGTWHLYEDEFEITWREKWLEFPYMAYSVAYFDRRVGNQLIDRLNGYRATIDATGVTFPEMSPDIFDKTDTTYWGAGIPNTAGDNRKWLFAELSWEFMVDYATDAAHGRLFMKDFGSDVRNTLPIIIFSSTRTEAQQSEIITYLETYFFLVDEDGNIVIDTDNAYLVSGNI